MKIIPILLAVICLSPLASYANNTDSGCGAYVKNIKLDNSSFRFRLVDLSGKNFKGSNDWSFTAGNSYLADMLNTAYLLKGEICINYTYHSGKWEITNVKI